MSPRAYTPEQDAVIAKKFESGACLAELRREFGGSFYAMRSALIRQGVYVSRPGGYYGRGGVPRHELSASEIARAVEMWNAEASTSFIARELGIDRQIIRRELRARDLDVVARPSKASGPNHGAWKGGRTSRGGYTYLLLDRGHPFAGMCNKHGYVAEHRLVMAESLGRPLARYESVHHINGVRDDNRLENLQLRQGQHGKGVVMRCSDCGSVNVETVPLGS